MCRQLKCLLILIYLNLAGYLKSLRLLNYFILARLCGAAMIFG
ncbi:hypothetical protein SynA18461_00385 [Synechococcus sp. A18-46.1]|nr:hypothetical protein SynA18461_00385 [Synechococcus sp. A18-46.1]